MQNPVVRRNLKDAHKKTRRKTKSSLLKHKSWIIRKKKKRFYFAVIWSSS